MGFIGFSYSTSGSTFVHKVLTVHHIGRNYVYVCMCVGVGVAVAVGGSVRNHYGL